MTVFNIASYFEKIPKSFRQKISEVVKDNRELIKAILTTEALTEQARKSRPDLYKVLITQQGQIWTERFMKYIQRVIFAL
ncbi:hypothetical protein LCGC14_1381320 [marine sediment metagenome]|uniref:Uncharacterized protein n=1 Tax=marine sediment metagenome TaxID=412755 RepID=A0A0F9K2P8_9ZZZZ